jgi:hypothetical protein
MVTHAISAFFSYRGLKQQSDTDVQSSIDARNEALHKKAMFAGKLNPVPMEFAIVV